MRVPALFLLSGIGGAHLNSQIQFGNSGVRPLYLHYGLIYRS